MRVIAGRARRVSLSTPPGESTRPTTDRIKETLFNILQNDIPECRFLDLFAGSGAIGIEALSRGASHAVFVESDKVAVGCIRENLKKTHLDELADVRHRDVIVTLRQLGKSEKPFDIIFADPPYRMGFEKKILAELADSSIASDETLIIIEAALDTPIDFIDDSVYDIERVKEYKTNQHIFIKKHGGRG